jgi:hypothetical protein
MSMSKFGTFSDLLEATAPNLQPIAQELRAIIFEVDPHSIEVVRLGERAATYGVGPKKMSEGYVYIMPHKNWINLGFYCGVHLPDPARLLEGAGKNLRHIKMRKLADTERPEVKRLIRAAYTERKEYLSG